MILKQEHETINVIKYLENKLALIEDFEQEFIDTLKSKVDIDNVNVYPRFTATIVAKNEHDDIHYNTYVSLREVLLKHITDQNALEYIRSMDFIKMICKILSFGKGKFSIALFSELSHSWFSNYGIKTLL